ncbi:MAG: MarR family winged helix-turn-helix transcriptional regulator [Actinomycetota bacterium]
MAVIDEMVCFSMYSASRATTRAYATLLSPWNLSYPQYLVLVVLWLEGEKTVNEISDLLQLDSGTVSPLLRRMAEKGLIDRRRDQQDQRVVTIAPTDRAHELRTELAHVPAAIANAMGLPSIEAARELTDALHRLTAGMADVRAAQSSVPASHPHEGAS